MISVCIATYNGEKYIQEQLASILPQLGIDDEVIISDDGSTDNTIKLILALQDRRIKITKGPRQNSPIWNFENALKQAKGEYIFLADQDDVWKPNKVKICTKWLGTYACVISDAEVTDQKLNVVATSLFKMLHVKKGKLYNACWKNGYTGCCMAFRHSILEMVLPFPSDIPMHDIWIGNVAAFHYQVKFTNEELIYFRRHQNSNSCNGKGSKYSYWQRLLFRWKIIKNLILISRKPR